MSKHLQWETVTMSDTGTVKAAVAGSRYRFYRCSFSPSADLSGQATLDEGSTARYGVYDGKAGAEYGFDQGGTAYVELATNTALKITLPSATATDVNIMYEIVTP